MHAVAVIVTLAAFSWYAGAPARSLQPAQTLCVVSDPRAVELSGLVATEDGYIAINDSRADPSQTRILYLDQQCRVRRAAGYPTPARDPEDLAVAPDGAIWVADIGDNLANRASVALWRLPPGGGAPVIYRLTYPDGPQDAEALLFTGTGAPLIITKSATTKVYAPATALVARSAKGVPMKLVARLDQPLITGAATSPDRRRVALRGYTGAYEWDVSDGDVVKALTSATAPRVIPLLGEPQGEAVAYSQDNQALLTVSDAEGPTELRRYPDPPPTGSGNPAGTSPAAMTALPGEAEPPLWYALAAAAGGLVLLLAGLVGLRRSRRSAQTESP